MTPAADSFLAYRLKDLFHAHIDGQCPFNRNTFVHNDSWNPTNAVLLNEMRKLRRLYCVGGDQIIFHRTLVRHPDSNGTTMAGRSHEHPDMKRLVYSPKPLDNMLYRVLAGSSCLRPSANEVFDLMVSGTFHHHSTCLSIGKLTAQSRADPVLANPNETICRGVHRYARSRARRNNLAVPAAGLPGAVRFDTRRSRPAPT